MWDPFADLAVPFDADRETRLAPDRVRGWTDMVRRMAPHVRQGRRPCDWLPWSAALDAAVPPMRERDKRAPLPSEHLRAFMEASAQPRWPEGRQDLIEWALTFLEADVMLFRSGYAKKNLLTRLRQSPLQPNDVARIEALVRRAVTQGTGVEEQRGYRRIAARLVYENHAPNLRSWLEAQAEGAVLSFNKADAAMLADIFNAPLSDEGRAKLEKGGFLLRPGWGLVLPGLTEFVRCPRGQDDVAAKRKLSAYRMLCAIRQREGSMPGPWAGKALAGVDAGR